MLKSSQKKTANNRHKTQHTFTASAAKKTRKTQTSKRPTTHTTKRQTSTTIPTPTTTPTTTPTPLPSLRDHKRLKIKHLTSQLQSVDSLQPQREAWWIISKKSKIPERILRLAVRNDQPDVVEPDIDVSDLLSPLQLEEVYTAIDNRVRLRKPLQYILGDVDFCKMQLTTKEGILIPRPETEHIVTWLTHQIKLYNQYVLHEKSSNTQGDVSERDREIGQLITQKKLFDYAEENVTKFHGKYPLHRFRFSWFDAIDDPIAVQQRVTKQNKLKATADGATEESPVTFTAAQTNHLLQKELEEIKIFDLCSGSGNITLALATQFPHANVVGVDIDRNALKLSRYNKQQLAVKNAKFYHCDLFRNSISQTNIPIELTADEYPERTTTFEDDHQSHAKPIEGPVSPPKHYINPNANNTLSSHRNLEEDHQILEPYLGLYDLTMLSSLADIIVSNPPYIQPEQIQNLDPEVKNWENHYALTPLPSFYDYPEIGVPYPILEQDKIARGITELPPWPTKEQIKQHALPFYERIIKSAPRLLTHNEHFVPRQGIKFPRLVLEIGHDEQALHVANMASYIFDVEVFCDGYDSPRWIVGYEPPGYH